MNKYALIGYKYAVAISKGEITANKWIKLECERYLARLDGADLEIYFDYNECQIIYDLLGIINYATGFFIGEPIIKHITGFQAMLLENIFCLKYKATDEKVIEEVYLELGRKSGKSFIASLIEILIMLRSEKFSQHATAGKTREISSLVRNSMIEIIKSSPSITKYFKIRRDQITCLLNDCTSKHLSGEADNINGLRLDSYVVDEVANMNDGSVVDALKLSQMSVKSRLAIYISTQYANPRNVFNELLEYHKKILLGEIKTKNTFGLLYELDENDSYEDMSCWIKCSPLQMQIDDGIKFLKQEYEKGKSVPSSLREFRIKILNERLVEKSSSFIGMEDYEKCVVDKPPIDINGAVCFVGVDLSKVIDTTGVSFVYPYLDGNTLKQYVEVYNFLPNEESLVEHTKMDKYDYLSAKSRGEIITTDNVIIDQEIVLNFIVDMIKKYDLKCQGICIDPHNSSYFVTQVEKLGYEVYMIYQSAKHISEPIETLKAQILEQRVLFKKNDFLKWQFSNCKVVTDTQGYSRLDKFSKNCNRIDGVASSIDALKLSFYYKPQGKTLEEILMEDDYFV